MLKEHFDVLVVGGGPAGLAAARTAASLNLSVCVFEIQKDYEQIPRACSSQFILDDGYEGERLQIKNGKIQFQRCGFTMDYQGDLTEIKNKYYHSPQDYKIHFANLDHNAFAVKFDKQRLIKELAKDCIALDVQIKMGTVVTAGMDFFDHVELIVKQNGRTSQVSGKRLIIAEGVNARLTRQFSIMNHRKIYAKVAVAKYYVKNITEIEPNSWNLYYGVAYHSYSPVIIGPALNDKSLYEVTISCSALDNPDKIYHSFTTDSPVRNQFRNSYVVMKSACAVTAAESILSPWKGNVISIGDCAAYVEVEVQGAIMCGYYAAFAVKEELENKAGFQKYTEWWKKSFEFNREEYLQVSQGYALVPTYTDDELDYLFWLISNEVLEGTYSQYRTPKLIWDAIKLHSEDIIRDHPEIYEKMQKNQGMNLTKTFERFKP